MRFRSPGTVELRDKEKRGPLSPREEQILGLAAGGLTDQEIGQALGISTQTLSIYWERMLAKYGGGTRAVLVAEFINTQSAELKKISDADRIDPKAVGVYLETELLRLQAAEQKAARALSVLRAFFTESSRTSTEQELVRVACKVLVEDGGYVMAWLGVPMDDDEKSVKPISSYPPNSAYLDQICVSWGDNPFGQGPVGRAMRLGQMEVAQDFLVNPAMSPWFAAAQEFGFQSILAFPIHIDEKVAMVLAVYALEPDAFDTQERNVLSELGMALASGLKMIRDIPMSDARLRLMVAEAPIAIRLSRDGISTYVNKQFLSMFRLERAECDIGKSVADIWDPECNFEIRERVRRHRQGVPLPPSFEGIARLPDGGRLHVHADIKELDLVEGRTAVAFYKEVEPPDFRKRAFSLARIGASVVDFNSGRSHVSAELAQLLAVGNDPFEIDMHEFRRRFYHPDDLPLLVEGATRAYAVGEPLTMELRVIRANGEIIWVRLVSNIESNDRGEPVIYGILQDINEQKEAANALVSSEFGLREAQRLSNIGSYYWDVKADINYWSEELYRIVGWDPSVPAPRYGERADLYTPESFQRLSEAVSRCLSFGEPYDLDVGILRSGNELRRCHARGEAVYGKDGTVVGVQGTLQDITKQKEAEEALVASEFGLREAQRLTNIGNFYWDAKRNISNWSDELYKIIGCDPADFDKWHQERAKHYTPESLKRLDEAMTLAQSSDQPYDIEVEIIRDDGVHRHIRACGEAIYDVSGAAVGLRGTYQDITERHASKIELQKNQRETLLLLNSTAQGIYGVDLQGKCTFCNQAGARMLGYESADDTIGKLLHELHHEIQPAGTDGQESECPLRRAIDFGESIYIDDDLFSTREGAQFPVEYWAHPIYDEETIAGAVITFFDITERKTLKAQLLQSQKMEAIGQLTGGIAHDFNNFLTVVLGCSELLADEFAGDPRLSGITAMIQTAAKRGADLTHQMLAFGRRQTLKPRPTDLNQLVDGVTNLLRRTLRGDIDISTPQTQGLWTAIADHVQVESAILNLCLNAQDAMPDGGRLTIETSNEWLDEDYSSQHSDVTPGPYVAITVTDTGSGIAAEHINKIFDPFFTTKEAGKGTGLGLSMVFGFVKQSQGHVMTYSELGIGTSVRIYLPRDESNNVEDDRPKGDMLDLRGAETILLVEDDPLVLKYAEGQLSSLGYKVISATNGKDALDLFEGNLDIDLLFTDIVMPGGMNGLHLASEASKLRPGLKVLLTSGYTEHVVRNQGDIDDSIEILNKPYTRNQLGTKIRSVLEEP